jgi:hypothetical protein
MENKIIVTIGRQFGSGGREIGQKLAEMLGIAYYDKELMAMAAKDSGLCEEFFEKADERVSGNLSYAFSLGIHTWEPMHRLMIFYQMMACLSCSRTPSGR